MSDRGDTREGSSWGDPDLLEGIVQTSPIGIAVVDNDGTVTFANERAEEIYGRSREEITEFSYDDPRWDLVNEDGEPLEGGEAPFERVVEREEAIYDQVIGFRRPSGERVWLSVNGAPQWNDDGELHRAFFAFQDITDDVETQRKLEESERRYRTLAENFPSGAVGLFNENLEYTAVGGQLLERLDLEPEDRIGLSIHEIHPAGLLEQIEPHFEAALEGEANSFEVEFRGRHLVAHTHPVRNADDEVYGGMLVVQDVTERREREQALEESEARFRLLAENLDEMIWISDADTREILYINPAYEEIWGRDRGSLYDDPTTFLEAVHPDDRQRVEQAYADVPKEGFDEEYRIARPDGEVRWLTVRAASIRDDGKERVIGIAEDITERKERERALEESEQRYRTLAENFPNGAVGLFNEELEYTAVGGQLLDATGVEPEDRVGSKVVDIYPDDIVDEVEPYFHAALEGEANDFEVEYHERHLYAHTLPVRNADDEVFAGMLVVQDVTDRREYERRLEESNERLEQFAYAASHDLQEPLRMVSSYLQLIEVQYGDELDAEGEEFLEFAVDGADRMREMVEGLLEYSRIETGGDSFELVDLDEVLEDALVDLQLQIEEHEADITVEDLPMVHGDGDQLRQVAQNLLDNAIEYTGDEPPRIHVAAERYGSEWRISVRDEGIGIDGKDADRIFDVFHRLHTNDEHPGTGIGLALCERIVEHHGGEIWVDSEPGEGSTFTFTLPATDEHDRKQD